MGKRERAKRKEERGKCKDVIDAHGLLLLVRHWSVWNQIYFLREVKDDSTWEKSMFSMPFIPHLNGSRSTQVSRLLHTSVHHTPHLCGLNTHFQPLIKPPLTFKILSYTTRHLKEILKAAFKWNKIHFHLPTNRTNKNKP